MKKLFSVLILTLTLAACASGDSGLRTWDSSLNGLRGKPLNDAVIMLGKPTGQYTKGEAVTYVWQDRKSESAFGPSVTRRGGYQIGSALDNGNAFIWSGIEYYTCVIRATTVNGTITRITSEGNPSGCEVIHGFHRMPLGKNAGSFSH